MQYRGGSRKMLWEGEGGGGYNKCLSHDHAVSAILDDPNQYQNGVPTMHQTYGAPPSESG